MSAKIQLHIRLGPFVKFHINGDNCEEISDALKGYDKLNKQIDDMCSDLVERIYPDGVEAEPMQQSDEG